MFYKNAFFIMTIIISNISFIDELKAEDKEASALSNNDERKEALVSTKEIKNSPLSLGQQIKRNKFKILVGGGIILTLLLTGGGIFWWIKRKRTVSVGPIEGADDVPLSPAMSIGTESVEDKKKALPADFSSSTETEEELPIEVEIKLTGGLETGLQSSQTSFSNRHQRGIRKRRGRRIYPHTRGVRKLYCGDHMQSEFYSKFLPNTY